GGIKPNIACGLVLVAPHFFVEDISITSIKSARQAFDSGVLRSGLEKYHGPNTAEAFNGWNGAWLNPQFRNWNITKYLADITVPVLGLQGIDDEYGTAAQLAAMDVERAGPTTTRFLGQCGHAPHHDQAAIATDLIAEFIAQSPEIGI
ncbi:MAG: alpha/beta fold hydrolase, partial [Aestuariivirgaceae bacterium]